MVNQAGHLHKASKSGRIKAYANRHDYSQRNNLSKLAGHGLRNAAIDNTMLKVKLLFLEKTYFLLSFNCVDLQYEIQVLLIFFII